MTVLLSLLFTLMLVAYTGLRYAEIETKRLVEIVVVNEVEKNMTAVLDKANEFIPFEYEEQLQSMIEDIQVDENLDVFVEKYAGVFVEDVLKGSSSGKINFNAEAQKITDVYLDDFASLTSGVVRPEVQKEILKDVLSKVDFNDQYNRVIQKVSPKISPNQKDILQKSTWFLENYPMMKKILLFGMFVTALFALALNLGLPSMFGVVGLFAGFSAIAHQAAYWVFSIWGNQILRPYKITLEPHVFKHVGRYAVGIFVMSMLLRLGSKKMIEKKEVSNERSYSL